MKITCFRVHPATVWLIGGTQSDFFELKIFGQINEQNKGCRVGTHYFLEHFTCTLNNFSWSDILIDIRFSPHCGVGKASQTI